MEIEEIAKTLQELKKDGHILSFNQKIILSQAKQIEELEEMVKQSEREKEVIKEKVIEPIIEENKELKDKLKESQERSEAHFKLYENLKAKQIKQ
jgi:hypothetical protein